jgi:hypothetical protein
VAASVGQGVSPAEFQQSKQGAPNGLARRIRFRSGVDGTRASRALTSLPGQIAARPSQLRPRSFGIPGDLEKLHGAGAGFGFADAVFEAMESSHSPSRVKMCDGMCSACGESGAIFAYARAALRPSSASDGQSTL